MQDKDYKIKVTKNGPYFISGNIPLDKEFIKSDKEGYPIKYVKGKYYHNKKNYLLCRCGNSKHKPYCDNTHIKISFDGTETASKNNYIDRAKKIPGPKLILNNDPELCASARFCTRAGGIRKLTENSDDKKSKKTAVQEVCSCPSGSLVIIDKKTGRPIEPDLKNYISILEDPDKKVGGQIQIKGGIPVESSEGFKYEIRNRVALCRCGKSDNKPFCDGNHITFGFIDDSD